MADKIKKNPKRPETKVSDSLTKSWLSAHGFDKQLEKVEAKERSRRNDPLKREVLE